MSRIGKKPVEIPKGVTVTLKEDVITVKGPKGELQEQIHPDISVEVKDGQVLVIRHSEVINISSFDGFFG